MTDGFLLAIDENTPAVVDHIACQPWVLGKKSVKPFKLRSTCRTSEPGHTIHADIGGSLGVSSLEENKYFVLIKGEASNYRFLYLIKRKSDAFEAMQMVIV